MRLRRAWVVFLAAAGAPALGHHNLTGLYERDNDTTMHGVVAEFRFVNPHPVLVIEVRADDESIETWELEMDNRRELRGIGMTAGTFEPGDQVFVRGSVGRTRPRALYLRRLDRPADGLWYEQRGSRPDMGVNVR